MPRPGCCSGPQKFLHVLASVSAFVLERVQVDGALKLKIALVAGRHEVGEVDGLDEGFDLELLAHLLL